MRVLLSVVLMLGLLVSLEVSAQQKPEVDKSWLSKKYTKYNNLLILNDKGFKAWIDIIDTYRPSSLILGYYINDSLFIYNADTIRKNESCLGVMEDRLTMYIDSVIPFCQYSKIQFFKDEYFWQRKPGKPTVATMIVLYGKAFGRRHKKFLRHVKEYSMKTGVPYVLLFGDYAKD